MLSDNFLYIFCSSPITKKIVIMTIIHLYYMQIEQTKDSWNCRLVYNLQFKEFFTRFSWKLFLKSKIKSLLCKNVPMMEKLDTCAWTQFQCGPVGFCLKLWFDIFFLFHNQVYNQVISHGDESLKSWIVKNNPQF